MILFERARPWFLQSTWVLCIALPWLNPFTLSPSSSVVSLLLSWSLAALLALWVAHLPASGVPRGRGLLAQWGGGGLSAGPTERKAHISAVSERLLRDALVLCFVASLLWVPQVLDRALTAGLLAALCCVGLMVAVGRRAALHPQLVRCCVGALLAAAALSALIGVLQYLGWAGELSPWISPTSKDNVFANLRQRNQFATLTSLGLLALLAWMAVPKTLRQDAPAPALVRGPAHAAAPESSLVLAAAVAHTPATRAAAWLLLHVLAMGVVCSQSRTGLLQWGSVGLLGLWALVRHWRAQKRDQSLVLGRDHLGINSNTSRTGPCPTWAWLALAAPLLVVFWSVCLPALAQWWTGELGGSVMARALHEAQRTPGCESRRVLWHNVWTAIAQRPWLGWGWGETDYAHFMSTYNGLRFCALLDNAHNLPLQLALEFGVPLTLAGAAGVAVWVWRRAPWREVNVWRLMAWGLLAVLAIHSLLEYPLWYGPFQMVLGLALGLLWVQAPNAAAGGDVGQPDPRQPCGPNLPALSGTAKSNAYRCMAAAVVLLLCCVYAAWDYHRVSQIYLPINARDARYRDQPLHHAKQSWLFKNQADFAELTTRTITPANAAQLYPLALDLMHYSPEARVVQRAIDSAQLLGHTEMAQLLKQRLEAATPPAPAPASTP